MSVPKIVVHTDILLEHLCGSQRPSVLRRAMGKFFCYVTAFHAIELFALARTRRETLAVKNVMAAMKVLGLNPRNAPIYGQLLASHPRHDRWTLLIAGLCAESRLPILTAHRREFAGLEGVTVVPPGMIESERSGEEILRSLRRARR